MAAGRSASTRPIAADRVPDCASAADVNARGVVVGANLQVSKLPDETDLGDFS
jgi:hypothetical protein